jgi:hypothetical protein
VDILFACLPGKPAFEVPDADALGYQGIYTACLLAAYGQPTDDMVQIIDDKMVVPSRKLSSYLEREVRRRAAAKPIRMNQFPQTVVNSSDNTYLGRALSVRKSVTTQQLPQATIFDVAGLALTKAGLQTVATEAATRPVGVDAMARDTGFEQTQAIVRASAQAPIHSETGFTILGAPVASAITHPAIRTELISIASDSGGGTGIRVDLNAQPACSVALRFADGSGTVLAALRGFIGTVVLDSGSIINVSYAPSPNNELSFEFQQERERLREMRAAVAAAVRYGVFQIDGDRATRERKAAELADKIRVLKAVDPTLGLYAAYAYAEANLINQVRSVNQFMRNDLHVEIFDVKLLSGELFDRPLGESVVPFCPMLTQGWGLLRVKGARVADEVAAAQDHVRRSPWTMLAPDAYDDVRAHRGRPPPIHGTGLGDLPFASAPLCSVFIHSVLSAAGSSPCWLRPWTSTSLGGAAAPRAGRALSAAMAVPYSASTCASVTPAFCRTVSASSAWKTRNSSCAGPLTCPGSSDHG